MLKVELGRALLAQVVLEDAERVEGRGVVTTDLVGADEQLDLEVVRDLARALTEAGSDGRRVAGADGRIRGEARRGREGLSRRQALVETREVGRPRNVDRFRVL